MASEMTSKERVMAALYGKEFDVFPAVSLTSAANLEGMKCSGAFYPEAHLDGAKMAALAAVGHSHMNFDTVAPYFSILLEASALGSEIDWGGWGSLSLCPPHRLSKNRRHFHLP